MTTTTRQQPRRGFRLGQLYLTRSINDRVATSEPFAKGILDALRRHARGDWGEVCGEDGELNDLALVHGDRLLSVYTIRACPERSEWGERVWIITAADRSSSCLLLPSEY